MVSDNVLITKCKSGDMQSFRQLLEHYQPYVYSIAYRFMNNKTDAEDLVQDCFVKVWKNLHRFDERFKFTTWLYKIITNLCFDRFKQKKREKTTTYEDVYEYKNFESFDPTDVESNCINNEMRELITKLVNELSPKQKMIFILRDLEDVDVSEVGKIMKLSPGKIKSNLYYARKNIREKLETIYNVVEL